MPLIAFQFNRESRRLLQPIAQFSSKPNGAVQSTPFGAVRQPQQASEPSGRRSLGHNSQPQTDLG